MFKGQHHESRKSLSLLLTLEHAYCKSQLLRGTFCFTQVQGPNALTTLLHLADGHVVQIFISFCTVYSSSSSSSSSSLKHDSDSDSDDFDSDSDRCHYSGIKWHMSLLDLPWPKPSTPVNHPVMASAWVDAARFFCPRPIFRLGRETELIFPRSP